MTEKPLADLAAFDGRTPSPQPEALSELATLVRVLVYNLASTHGDSPYMQALWEWCHSKPEEGDLVVENSTIWYTNRNLDGVGYFLREAIEDIPGWEEEDEPNPGERVQYIRTLDGREFRWTNAGFYRAPKHLISLTAEETKVTRPGVNPAFHLDTNKFRWRTRA